MSFSSRKTHGVELTDGGEERGQKVEELEGKLEDGLRSLLIAFGPFGDDYSGRQLVDYSRVAFGELVQFFQVVLESRPKERGEKCRSRFRDLRWRCLLG